MEALKRKIDDSVKDSMNLSDGTLIELIRVPARKVSELQNNKRYTDFERGLHLTASKIRVNGQTVVADDLLDCFDSDELEAIGKFANMRDKEDESKNE